MQTEQNSTKSNGRKSLPWPKLLWMLVYDGVAIALAASCMTAGRGLPKTLSSGASRLAGIGLNVWPITATLGCRADCLTELAPCCVSSSCRCRYSRKAPPSMPAKSGSSVPTTMRICSGRKKVCLGANEVCLGPNEVYLGANEVSLGAKLNQFACCVFRTHQRTQQTKPRKFLGMLSLYRTSHSMLCEKNVCVLRVTCWHVAGFRPIYIQI